jgi:hypothetical protein
MEKAVACFSFDERSVNLFDDVCIALHPKKLSLS